MKTSFLILVLLASNAFAGITMAIIERQPAFDTYTYKKDGSIATTSHHDACAKVSAYGLLPNGASKNILLTNLSKITAIENCALFNLNRDTIREIIYFDENCIPTKIDFHMEGKFEVQTFSEFDEQTLITIGTFEAFLESQP